VSLIMISVNMILKTAQRKQLALAVLFTGVKPRRILDKSVDRKSKNVIFITLSNQFRLT